MMMRVEEEKKDSGEIRNEFDDFNRFFIHKFLLLYEQIIICRQCLTND